MVSAAVIYGSPLPAWASDVTITSIQLNSTNGDQVRINLTGLEVETLQPLVTNQDRTVLIDLVGAQLQLDGEESFLQLDPAEGLSSIELLSLDSETVRLEIVGQTSRPQVEIITRAESLEILVVIVEGEDQASQLDAGDPAFELDEIEVRAARDRFRVGGSSTATRIPIDLRDLPLAVQVVPEQVFEDQGATELTDILRNVSGVSRTSSSGETDDSFVMRGFNAGSILRDGFRDGLFLERSAPRETANLEQVEVLKGPSSILQGQLSPGGVINLVTKQPLSEPFVEADLQLGNFGFVRSTIDLSGSLTGSGNLRYRVNVVNEDSNSFRNFTNIERHFIAPILTWEIGDRTTLTVNGEYLYDERPFDRGVVALGTQIAGIPFNRRLGEPFDISRITEYRVGYLLEHRLGETWSLQQSLQAFQTDRFRFNTEGAGLNESTGLLSRNFVQATPEFIETFTFRNEAIGEFSTGSIENRLLVGVEAARQTRELNIRFGPAPALDIFNPVYLTTERPVLDNLNSLVVSSRLTQVENLAFYGQNVVSLSEELKILLSGRLDLLTNGESEGLTNETIEEDFTELTPQFGVVYQPADRLALYANYSESFNSNPSILTEDGTLLSPETGQQFEVGIKADLSDRLTATLAAYQITRQNVATTNPVNPNFVIPVGEQRSRGIELDLTGELAPGWNVIASYSFIDAEVTQDNNIEIGNRLIDVPENSGSIWTTYEWPEGSSLEGLGLGFGFFGVGERQGDVDNSFTLDPYTLIDAAVFYERENASVSLNFKNILNQQYIESGGTRTSVFPGEPFTVQGSISVNF
jgi:iron complex outermembrane receptor protein